MMKNGLRHIMQNMPALLLAAAGFFPSCNAAELSQAPPAAPQTESRKTSGTQPCKPLENRAREATDYQPAFKGQTRACGVTSQTAFDITVFAKGLQQPWAVEPLPDGQVLVTEKRGQMHVVSTDGKIGPAIAGVPAVDARGQGGLLDVALSPGFESDRTIYWSFTEPRGKVNGTSVARGVLSADGKRLDEVQVILHTRPSYANNMHFGSRLAFGPDKMLYVTTGERSDQETRPQAQQLSSHFGKVLRIQPNGAPAPGNPFADQTGALPEIWTYGHRNIQASAFDAQGRLWVIEHGPRGGDEVNLLQPSKNYGWPLITYGIEYSGPKIKGATTQRAGLEQPVYYWDPVIAPSGAQFYSGDAFPQWKGNLFIGALRETSLVRLVIENDRVVGEEHLLVDKGQRIRDVRQSADGLLYVAADNGEIWKLAPRK